jgi:predicted acetyltransferase
MTLEIIPASAQQHDTVLRNLYQFYLYEFSRIVEGHVTPSGRFEESDLDACWTKKGRHNFLVEFEGHLAGFAIVDEDINPEAESGAKPLRYMREFFVMARFQGRGIGEKVALYCFDRFPGKWKISELVENINAQHFWRKIIERYMGAKPDEATLYDGSVIAQYFDTADRAK